MKKITNPLIVLACTAMPLVSGSVLASEFLNTKPLLKETVAANPGLEVIAPLDWRKRSR